MPEAVRSQRLASLDVLRGFDMLFIMGGWQFLSALWIAFGGAADSGLAAQMTHAEWEGFHFIDWIAPLFLFITGVSFPFSFASQVKKGFSRGRIVLRILRRGAVLFALGAVCSGFFTHFGIHFGSILGRIGIAWALAALAYVHLPKKAYWSLWTAAFLAYAGLMFFVSAPDHPDCTVFSQAGNISGYLDRMIFPKRFLAGGGLYLSQGFLATVLAAPVMVALGMSAGDLLRRDGLSGNRRAARLALLGIVLIAAGLALSPVIPLNKTLWSASYQLLTGGLGIAALAVCYWLVDVSLWWKRTLFLRVIGLNAIFIYVIQRVVPFEEVSKFFVGGLAARCPENWGAVLVWGGYVALCWLILLAMHRQKIYFKV